MSVWTPPPPYVDTTVGLQPHLERIMRIDLGIVRTFPTGGGGGLGVNM